MCPEKIIQNGIGTIYHELGHVFGYCLANKKEKTYLGKITELSIGVKRNTVIVENSFYHYGNINQERDIIKANTSNKERTVAWFVEVISGCTFQAIHQNVEFNLCFGADINKLGYTDFSNVSSIARYSSFHYTIDEIYILQEKYFHFLLKNKILNSFAPIVNEIVILLRNSHQCQVTFNNQEVEWILDSVSEIIDENIVIEYSNIIQSF